MQHVDLIKIAILGFVSISCGLVSIPIPFKDREEILVTCAYLKVTIWWQL